VANKSMKAFQEKALPAKAGGTCGLSIPPGWRHGKPQQQCRDSAGQAERAYQALEHRVRSRGSAREQEEREFVQQVGIEIVGFDQRYPPLHTPPARHDA